MRYTHRGIRVWDNDIRHVRFKVQDSLMASSSGWDFQNPLVYESNIL